jgi:cell pole-organizing protein PopZ
VPQTFQSPSYTPIQTGFTPPAQLRPHLLLGTPFSDFSATYSELTGQPTPSYTIVVTTSEMSASETAELPVSGAATTETVPSLVASTDPPTLGVFQAQATVTAPIVATIPSIVAPALQTQTASLPHLSTEGQPDSSESEEDTSQFVITPRSSAPNTTASVPPSDP